MLVASQDEDDEDDDEDVELGVAAVVDEFDEDEHDDDDDDDEGVVVVVVVVVVYWLCKFTVCTVNGMLFMPFLLELQKFTFIDEDEIAAAASADARLASYCH